MCVTVRVHKKAPGRVGREGGGGHGNSYSGPYGETLSNRSTFFTLEVYLRGAVRGGVLHMFHEY